MCDQNISGMGDHSLPPEPDWEQADEDALIAVVYEDAKQCVADLKEIAEDEHAAYYKSIGKDPDLQAFTDYNDGLWYGVYADACDALAEGVRLEKQRGEQNAEAKTATD